MDINIKLAGSLIDAFDSEDTAIVLWDNNDNVLYRNKKTSERWLKLNLDFEIGQNFYDRLKKVDALKLLSKQDQNLRKENYKKAKFYKETIDWIEALYMNCNFDYLSEINLYFIQNINKYLNIDTEIRFSKDFNLHKDRNMRLINLCKELKATDYFSGPAAKFYMNEDLFKENNININYLNYSNYPHYSQLYNGFEHGVSILDLLLNEGVNSIKFLTKVKL